MEESGSNGCGDAVIETVPGGSAQGQNCIVAEEYADQEELAGGYVDTMGAGMAGAVVPVSEGEPHPDARSGGGFGGGSRKEWNGVCWRAAIPKHYKKRTDAAAKTSSGGEDLAPTGGDSTDTAVLLEFGSDVDDQIHFGNDMRIDAAMGRGCMVCRMQAVEEEITKCPIYVLRLLEFCYWMEGCSSGWERSWKMPGWNMPGSSCGRKTIPWRIVRVKATRVVQMRRPRRRPTIATMCATCRLGRRVMYGGRRQLQHCDLSARSILEGTGKDTLT